MVVRLQLVRLIYFVRTGKIQRKAKRIRKEERSTRACCNVTAVYYYFIRMFLAALYPITHPLLYTFSCNTVYAASPSLFPFPLPIHLNTPLSLPPPSFLLSPTAKEEKDHPSMVPELARRSQVVIPLRRVLNLQGRAAARRRARRGR